MKRILNINNFFKTNENIRNFRKVDIQQLWNNFQKYRKEILNYNKNKNIIKSNLYDEFVNYILNPILKDKEIEFHEHINIFDDEVEYSFKGIVKDIRLKSPVDQINVLVNLYNYKDTIIMTKLESSGDNLIRYRRNPISTIIKVYDSNITTFEIMFDTLDDARKYNL